jgi:hypothetical protein
MLTPGPTERDIEIGKDAVVTVRVDGGLCLGCHVANSLTSWATASG